MTQISLADSKGGHQSQSIAAVDLDRQFQMSDLVGGLGLGDPDCSIYTFNFTYWTSVC